MCPTDELRRNKREEGIWGGNSEGGRLVGRGIMSGAGKKCKKSIKGGRRLLGQDYLRFRCNSTSENQERRALCFFRTRVKCIKKCAVYSAAALALNAL